MVFFHSFSTWNYHLSKSRVCLQKGKEKFCLLYFVAKFRGWLPLFRLVFRTSFCCKPLIYCHKNSNLPNAETIQRRIYDESLVSRKVLVWKCSRVFGSYRDVHWKSSSKLEMRVSVGYNVPFLYFYVLWLKLLHLSVLLLQKYVSTVDV